MGDQYMGEVEAVVPAVAGAVVAEAQPIAAVRGVLTSEFGVTVGTVASIVMGFIPSQYVPIVGGLAGLYTALRTLLKVVQVYRNRG